MANQNNRVLFTWVEGKEMFRLVEISYQIPSHSYVIEVEQKDRMDESKWTVVEDIRKESSRGEYPGTKWLLCQLARSRFEEERKRCQARPFSREEKREGLAQYAHVAWTGWMGHIFKRCETTDHGALMIPKEWVERWQRQMDTHYVDLSDKEKDSDRVEADRMLKVMGY